jgi:hypothetical protein
MLDAWHQFKITLVSDKDGVTEWLLLGQRHDGAVFWQGLSVYPQHLIDHTFREAFWMRAAQSFDHLDNRFSHAEAPRSSFVPFADTGYWFQDAEGNRYFK